MNEKKLTIENGVAHPGDQVALHDGSIWELCYQEEAPDQLMISDKETYKNAQNEWGAGIGICRERERSPLC